MNSRLQVRFLSSAPNRCAMNEDIVWAVKLDKKYDVKVTRTGDYTADLRIEEDGKVLHSEPVTLSFRALFGPDVADVADWERIAVKFVDSQKAPE